MPKRPEYSDDNEEAFVSAHFTLRSDEAKNIRLYLENLHPDYRSSAQSIDGKMEEVWFKNPRHQALFEKVLEEYSVQHEKVEEIPQFILHSDDAQKLKQYIWKMDAQQNRALTSFNSRDEGRKTTLTPKDPADLPRVKEALQELGLRFQTE